MRSGSTAEPRGRGLPGLVAITAVVAFVGLLAYGLLAKATDTTIDDALSRGIAPPAPGFMLEVLNAGDDAAVRRTGANGALSDGQLDSVELRGVPFVLNLWASWCQPCQQEAPVLEQGWRQLGGRGVLFVGLDMQDLSGDAQDFLKSNDITYPTIREPSNDVAKSYGATGIPETYFVDGDGRVVAHAIGVVSAAQLQAGVRAATQGRVLGTLSGDQFAPQR